MPVLQGKLPVNLSVGQEGNELVSVLTVASKDSAWGGGD